MSKWGKVELSNVGKLRQRWLKKGYDLLNITSLCELKLGNSGWGNGFNEPNEDIFHIQLWYRNEQVASMSTKSYVIDDTKYLLFIDNEDDVTGADFIIFRKVRL